MTENSQNKSKTLVQSITLPPQEMITQNFQRKELSKEY